MATAPFLHTHCPQCGSEMKYGGRKLACKSCDYSRSLGNKSDQVVGRGLSAGLDLSAFKRGLGITHAVYSCCKAKIAVPATQTEVICPFCQGEPEKLEEEIKVIYPEGIVPFTIPHKGVPGRMKNFVNNMTWFFRPKGFASIAKAENIQAIYIPVFLFDAFTRSSWIAESGYNDIFPDDYEGKAKGNPKTRWEDSRGYLEHNFVDEIMIAAGTRVAGKVFDALKIQALTGQIVEDYDPQYIQEFACELYQDDEEKGFGGGDNQMDGLIEGWIDPMIPGDDYRGLNIVTEKLALSYKHILMPVWVSSFRYRNTDHVFYMNGRTGKIEGKSPLSWEKVGLFILVAVIVLILLVLGIDQLRN